MKIKVKFQSIEDYDLFISLLRRIYKTIEVKQNKVGRYSYLLTLDDPVKTGRPKVELTEKKIAAITALLQQGRAVNNIANELHISRRQVDKIKKTLESSLLNTQSHTEN